MSKKKSVARQLSMSICCLALFFIAKTITIVISGTASLGDYIFAGVLLCGILALATVSLVRGHRVNKTKSI